MDQYPIKILPRKLYYWINQRDFFPNVPSAGKPPQREYANDSLVLARGCLNSIVFILIFWGTIVIFKQNYSLGFFFIIGVLLIRLAISYFNRIKITKENKVLELKFKSEIKSYESKIRALKTLWEIEKEELNQKYHAYEKSRYSQRFVKYFSRKASPWKDHPSQGFSENFFSEYLKKYFEGYVYNNLSLSIYNNNSTFNIYPDFLIYLPSHNFHLAIEIDEPYSSNGLETHYRDKNENGSNKDLRNEEHYSSAFWFVIRFSEEQIIQSPDECCFEIYNFIKEIYPEFKIFNSSFSNQLDITHNAWTFKDCVLMKTNKYRFDIHDKLYGINPFYNYGSNKCLVKSYEDYCTSFIEHKKDNTEFNEYVKIFQAMEKVDFDLEVRKFSISGKELSVRTQITG